jgi:hypothetical protein
MGSPIGTLCLNGRDGRNAAGGGGPRDMLPAAHAMRSCEPSFAEFHQAVQRA